MSENYEKQVYLAMLAEQCSRYEDMINFLEEMIKQKGQSIICHHISHIIQNVH